MPGGASSQKPYSDATSNGSSAIVMAMLVILVTMKEQVFDHMADLVAVSLVRTMSVAIEMMLVATIWAVW